jgi:hypothetical protein
MGFFVVLCERTFYAQNDEKGNIKDHYFKLIVHKMHQNRP